MKKVFTLAGSDTSGGAGIQADLKTFQELGVYGMTALTTIVTMDPKNGWNHNVFPIELSTIETQLDTILSVGIDAMKTGMLGSAEIIELAAKTIDQHGLEKVVIDPVLVCKGENEVLHPETAVALREVLVPKATVTTPNLFEASQLAQMKPLKTVEDMKEAAGRIHELGAKYVVVKGGADVAGNSAVDVLYDGSDFTLLESKKLETTYTHGAGCTFAAAITAELANGADPKAAIEKAKAFVTDAIAHGFQLNQYVGPVMHGAYHVYGEGSKK
ncbi:pyridoxine/pyridoxal/pyridoxamine kinase [Bacillus carboniphilus]|uniref:pyridoxal kinase n=1 Tax=Bacillus carboniphilus TaxID=86663 RepID=A0ABN0WKA1_9BACI